MVYIICLRLLSVTMQSGKIDEHDDFIELVMDTGLGVLL